MDFHSCVFSQKYQIFFLLILEYMHDTVFVSNLPETVTESEIAEYFGSIGIIKVCWEVFFKTS